MEHEVSGGTAYAAAASSSTELAEKLKAQGTAAYRARDFEKAERLYREAYEATPNNLLLLNNLGAVYLETGDYEKCLAVTQEALDKRYEVQADFASVAKILNRRAVCYARMKNFDAAIEAYKKSLVEVNERTTRAALREVEVARDRYLLLQKLNPKKADELRSEGNNQFKNGKYPEAKTYYDQALEHNPYDPKIYSNRAAAYIQLFEYPSALRDCEKALSLIQYAEQASKQNASTAATSPSSTVLEADATAQKDFVALERLEEEMKTAPIDLPVKVKIYSRQGMCHFRCKDYNKALTSYKEALALDPQNVEANRGLQQVYVTIQQSLYSEEVDEEQRARGMADPEVQQILRDPQLQEILSAVQSDPSRYMEVIQDPKIASAFAKLKAAGILRAR